MFSSNWLVLRKRALYFSVRLWFSGTNLDEIDAVGGARFDDGMGGDNEVQRTMLELINQLDGFDPRGNIKVSAFYQGKNRTIIGSYGN